MTFWMILKQFVNVGGPGQVTGSCSCQPVSWLLKFCVILTKFSQNFTFIDFDNSTEKIVQVAQLQKVVGQVFVTQLLNDLLEFVRLEFESNLEF